MATLLEKARAAQAARAAAGAVNGTAVDPAKFEAAVAAAPVVQVMTGQSTPAAPEPPKVEAPKANSLTALYAAATAPAAAPVATPAPAAARPAGALEGEEALGVALPTGVQTVYVRQNGNMWQGRNESGSITKTATSKEGVKEIVKICIANELTAALKAVSAPAADPAPVVVPAASPAVEAPVVAGPPPAAAPAPVAPPAPAAPRRGRPKKADAAPAPTVTQNAPASMPSGAAVVLPMGTSTEEFMLLVDVLSMKGAYIQQSDELWAHAKAEVERLEGLDYRLIKFEGGRYIAAQLKEDLTNQRPQGIFYVSSKICPKEVLEELIAQADVVLKGVF
ncbi:MAG: hypothetical protein WC718_17655 [Phycisphaerales bacterium]